MDYQTERADLAAAFRWAAREGMHEAVANHFSLAVSPDGRQFLMSPNQMHFSRINASDMLLIDANDPDTMARDNAPDPTAWGLHASVHRLCPHIKCLMHVHSDYATVLASLPTAPCPRLTKTPPRFLTGSCMTSSLADWLLKARAFAVPVC